MLYGLPSPRSTVTSAGARWGKGEDEGAPNQDEEQRVEDDPRPQDAARRARQLIARAVADEAPRAADPVHDRVARVDALRAVDALHLQPLADVDAGGTGDDAGAAVDAVARRRRGQRQPTVARLGARLAAAGIVADDQRAPVEQHGLEAAVRAGDDAHLLAQPAEVEQHQARSSPP